MTTLSLEGVEVRFGGVVALRGVDLTVQSGEVLAVVGPNGAGKTTLENVASGFVAPDGGPGEPGRSSVARDPGYVARHGIVRTFQGLRLFDGLSVLDNVRIGAAWSRRASVLSAVSPLPSRFRAQRQLTDRALTALEALDLESLASCLVTQLSQGQRRRVELARALAAEPLVLVLDEPGAGLDPMSRGLLAGAVRGVRDNGCAVLMVEHDLELASAVADRAIGLVNGAIVASGDVAQVKSHPEIVTFLEPR